MFSLLYRNIDLPICKLLRWPIWCINLLNYWTFCGRCDQSYVWTFGTTEKYRIITFGLLEHDLTTNKLCLVSSLKLILAPKSILRERYDFFYFMWWNEIKFSNLLKVVKPILIEVIPTSIKIIFVWMYSNISHFAFNSISTEINSIKFIFHDRRTKRDHNFW